MVCDTVILRFDLPDGGIDSGDNALQIANNIKMMVSDTVIPCLVYFLVRKERVASMPSLNIDKITAARKLFNDATLLFYERRSSISIHHLAHAAHEVLCAITGDSHMLDSVALTPEGKKKFKRIFNISKNFIKHADKDPNARLALNTETNILLLLDCAWIIILNFDKACAYSQTVVAWCAFVYPELFLPEHIQSLHNSVTVTFNLQDFEAIATDLKSHYHNH